MSTSSILGGSAAPATHSGKDVDALGPSDSSDSGSDVQGESSMPTAPDNAGEWGAVVAEGGTDSDAEGTGERASADGSDPVDGADVMPDRIIEDLREQGRPDARRKSLEAADLADDLANVAADEDTDVDEDDDAVGDTRAP